MFILQAPYPALESTTLLPNPQFSDSQSPLATLDQKRAMDGTLYLYVQGRADRQKLQWTFLMTRNKSLELRAFIQSYFASTIKITDHNEVVWTGNFTNNPFEFDTPERGGPAIAPMLKGESVTIKIEFEGVQNA